MLWIQGTQAVYADGIFGRVWGMAFLLLADPSVGTQKVSPNVLYLFSYFF